MTCVVCPSFDCCVVCVSLSTLADFFLLFVLRVRTLSLSLSPLYCTFSLLGEKGEGFVFSRPLSK